MYLIIINKIMTLFLICIICSLLFSGVVSAADVNHNNIAMNSVDNQSQNIDLISVEKMKEVSPIKKHILLTVHGKHKSYLIDIILKIISFAYF